MRLILISAIQIDKAVLFSALITVAGFVPLFTMEGVEGQIFGPMARTYGYALAGALVATFTITPVLASMLLPEHLKEAETIVVRLLHRAYNPALRFALARRPLTVGISIAFLAVSVLLGFRLGSEFLPHLEEGNFWIRASMPITLSLQDGEAAARKMREILLRHPEVITVLSQHGRPDDGSDASPFSNVELFAPLKPIRRVAERPDQGKADRADSSGVQQRIAGGGFQLLTIHPGQHRGRNLRCQRLQFGQDRRSQPRNTDQTR